METKLAILKRISAEKCTVQVPVPGLPICQMLSASVQASIACYIKSILKQHSAAESESNLVKALNTIQSEFKLTKLSSPEDSEQGITVKLSTKLMQYPFAIIKFATVSAGDEILHEIVIGLLLNTIRDCTPNFMYTYAGFLCSPPVDMPTLRQKREYNEYIFNTKIGTLTPLLNTLYFELMEEEEQDDEVSSKEVFVEYLPTFRNVMKQLFYKFVNTHNFRFIRQMKDECVEVLEQTLRFARRGTNKDKLQKYLGEVEHMLTRIMEEEDMLKKIARYFADHEEDELVQSSNLCANENNSTLLVSEFFDNAMDLREFVAQAKNKKDVNNVVLQVMLALLIAHKKLKFKHNDLHAGNILVQPLVGCALQYKLGSHRITLKANYIARIIDFGLSECMYRGQMVIPENEMYAEKHDLPDLQAIRIICKDIVSSDIFALLRADSYEEIEEYFVENYIE